MNCVWKEANLAKFEVLFRHLPGGTEEDHEKLVRIDGFWAKNSAICYHSCEKSLRISGRLGSSISFGRSD
jgi:hypothetical protein